ncbi:Cytochrome-P450 [Teratosphaeria destructans]|uniref:Cytochrome-P450 n=1 Tax=Teratosphaeria destructans TaxID=418781 RepID=A0A9W7VZ15_9PEZI|nr:Cytochrome-P450 [Teratosphaeria destructans]
MPGPSIVPWTLWTIVSGLLITAALVCAYTWLSTTLTFYSSRQDESGGSSKQPRSPPTIPYVVPGLGNTIGFSDQNIGAYWQWLRRLSVRYHSTAFAIMLAGVKTALVFSPEGVSALFRSRELSRAGLDQKLGTNVLAMSQQDAARAFPTKDHGATARIHSEHLLSTSAVHALTARYMRCFHHELHDDAHLQRGVDLNLYEWLWQRIFRSSTTALYGSKLLEMHPDFDLDYRVWEDNMLGLLFGTPRLFARKAYAARDRTVRKLETWLEEGYRSPAEGDPDWEPSCGARVVRKRHEYYKQQGMSIHAQAGADLIFLAGILSNATPATGWLLMHILSPTSPPSLKDQIMEELSSVKTTDGSIDVPGLTKLPLLNSAFHEILRLYVDLLVVRHIDESVALDSHLVRQGEHVMAPTWMTHRDAQYFARPTEFDPERFLCTDAETGKLSYSTSGLGGKYFPFGGGHYMCPGRIFAKQEVLGSVAVLLLDFDITFVGYVGNGGFPTPKKNYAGNQVVGIEGDLRVRVKRRAET